MASEPPVKRGAPDHSAISGVCGMPADAMYEVLLRLPAKDLCRLRAVCRSWRSLTYERVFVKDHTARHTRPLVATTFIDDVSYEPCGVSILDLLSGEVIKRIYTSGKDFRVQRTHTDLVCLIGGRHPLAISALDPATGAILSSSHNISEEYEDLPERRYVFINSCAFGKVPSTGQYKAFRFLHVGSPIVKYQVCEVMTLDGSGHARWRPSSGPPGPVCSSNKLRSVVISGIVYFLFDFLDPCFKYLKKVINPGSIASFNLETEEWMATIDGPEPVRRFYEDGNEIAIYDNTEVVEHLSITNLNESLVTVHVVRGVSMDLWFLMDIEKGLWVKKYSICSCYENICAYPFLVLDDERIIFIMQSTDKLEIYDPKKDIYSEMMELEDFRSVGIYTGNLLS